MPTQLSLPIAPTCSRCGETLSDEYTQEDHDAAHAGAERILGMVEAGNPNDWLMGAENDEHNANELAFLPLSGFSRATGRQRCGHQLQYDIGSFWPLYDVLESMSVDKALQSGLVPWSALTPRHRNRAACWASVAEAVMRLPVAQRRDFLLGRPIPDGLAARADSYTVEKIGPTQFWRRNGSMPVSGWAGPSGGYLHLEAYKVLDMLELDGFLETCLPEKSAIFRAFDLVRPEDVKVVFLGQDPYPSTGDAMGMAFSCHAAKLPASLRNIYKELVADLGGDMPVTGDLTPWTYQGVLLANTALTIGNDGISHFDYWQSFTDAWIRALASTRSIVWVLWGNHARRWKKQITDAGTQNQREQIIIESPHPSPLSAHRGFFGSKPFSKINEGLLRLGTTPICWRLPGG